MSALPPRPSLADQIRYPRDQVSLRELPLISMRAVSVVWHAAPKELTGTVLLQVVSSAVLGLQVLAGRYLLLRLLHPSGPRDFHTATPWLVLIAVLLAIGAIVAVLQTELQRLLSELVARFSMQRVLDVAATAELIAFDDPEFHDRLQRASINASMRPVQMTTGLVSVASAGLATIAVSAALVAIEPYLLVLGLLSAFPVTAMSLRLGRALYRFTVEQTPIERQRAYVQQLLSDKDAAKEVRAYGLGPFLMHRFRELYDTRLAALRKLIRKRSVQGVMSGLLTGVVTGGMLYLLVVFVSDGRISLAGAGAAVAALLLLASQVRSLSSGVGRLYESALFIKDVNDFDIFVREHGTVANGPIHGTPLRDGSRADSPASPTGSGAITVDKVSFTYPSRVEPSLVDVTLTVPRGQVIALVGENGSGKTTLAKLLAGLYRPQSGSITWDTPSGETQKAAVLFQDFVRYFMSARDNIAMGDWEHVDQRETVVEAAKQAGAHGFLAGLPGGYDSLLGPQFLGGSDLSGGQWQRVALARAFFRDASLVVLDEPTASLDPQAEADLFASVRDLFTGRSVVLITHRFGNVRAADRIYVLDQGRVIEEGRHEELMALGGTYCRLFTLQAESYSVVE